jgi:ADP-ribose pyrophosphatase
LVDLNVVVHKTKRVFDKFFKIDESIISYDRYDGRGRFEKVKRLVFERGDSAAILLRNPQTDEVMLVEQLRFPTFKKGPGIVKEVVAGIIDANETPDACARRETLEEIGFVVSNLEAIHTFYVSPGGSSERIILFYGEISNAPGEVAHGKGNEYEDVKYQMTPAEDFIALARGGGIQDAKTLIAAQWLALRRLAK